MKKTVYFISIMFFIVVVLPFGIVRGCETRDTSKISDNSQGVKIKVYINQEKAVKEMPLDDYIKGVVAAEMPAEFELEALKAQAVAARTYAYSRVVGMYLPDDNLHKDADVCTEHTHCQAWISKDDAMKDWGDASSMKYWNKIEKAVNETKGMIIYYSDYIINPVFHSNSGGRTENAEEVWAGDVVPYLKSVKSDGEMESKDYKNIVIMAKSEFISRIKGKYPNAELDEKGLLEDIEIKNHTEGLRVKEVRVGNITTAGTEMRDILSLKSANFTIEDGGDGTLKITTIGSGHGVGMSQWGANYLAKNGGTYGEILKYYYNGVTLKAIAGIKGR